MTLRVRLATAFFAVLLGPAVSGGYLAWAYWPQSMKTPDPDALGQRLVAECAHLSALAHGYAAGRCHPTGATVRGSSAGRTPTSRSAPPVVAVAGTSYTGLAARAEIRDADGLVTGYAYAVRPLDVDFLSQLSVAAGATVTPARLRRASAPYQDCRSLWPNHRRPTGPAG